MSPVRTCSSEDLYRQYGELSGNPHGYCPNHTSGVTLPADFLVTPLQYVD